MIPFRQRIAKARGTLHERMSLRALVFALPLPPKVSSVEVEGEIAFPVFGAEPTPYEPDPINWPILVDVRVHDKWVQTGELKGTNFHYAETEDISPKIIFWKSQLVPTRGMIVSVSEGLAYQIDSIKPHDVETITANAVRMAENKTVGFPVPEGF